MEVISKPAKELELSQNIASDQQQPQPKTPKRGYNLRSRNKK